MKWITAGAVKDYCEAGALLIDLRAREQYDRGHIPSAVSIPVNFLEEYEKLLPRDRVLVLYCEYADAAVSAGRKLTQHGYRVCVVNGGIRAYENM